MPNSWIEVDVAALEDNIRAFRRRAGDDVLVAPVVKSNGYGHGLELAATAFVRGGAHWLCVHSFAEARRVQRLELDVPVLVLGPLVPEEFVPAVAADLHCTVYEMGQIEALTAASEKLSRTAKLHLKVETGTNRQGIRLEDLDEFLQRIEGTRLLLAGVHSHFANVEDTTRHRFAQEQLSRFREALDRVRASGHDDFVAHMASSAAAILFEETHFDLVRPGISAYGHWPSGETLASANERSLADFGIRPAMVWKARVSQVKQVAAGEHVGYGRTHRVEVDSRIAVIGVGYADGYFRCLGGRAYVTLGGSRCPVVGRVCMNLMMVDVSRLPQVEAGSEVVLLAPEAAGGPSAEQVGEWAQTISYEVLAAVDAALPREAL